MQIPMSMAEGLDDSYHELQPRNRSKKQTFASEYQPVVPSARRIEVHRDTSPYHPAHSNKISKSNQSLLSFLNIQDSEVLKQGYQIFRDYTQRDYPICPSSQNKLGKIYQIYYAHEQNPFEDEE